MCKVQMLRALVNQRLAAVVEEIFVVLERTIAEYEEELSQTKEENERQRQLLDAVFKNHQVVLQRADTSEEHLIQRLHFKEEDEEPQPPHMKEEEEEHSISQEGEHLEGLEEFSVIGVDMKSEDDEDKGESEEKTEVEPPSSSSSQHMTTEADGDHCGGSQADNLLAPLSNSDNTTSHSPDADDEDSKADMTCHSDNTHFKCSHCGKTFNYHSNMKRHMTMHTGENSSACSVCNRRFSWGYLEVHMRTHTGEKPFPCSICNKRFYQRSTLVRHMRTHTGEKVLSCSVCGERFSYKYQLNNHKCAGENSSSK
ncbi:zinc finger protein 771-like isoform X1 [Dunckerocampus dactyliophorus]|uniref:zinc finger protein 771-like isoform X1 n=1 Tax=Dunckerocampus dactyliophorus TaxID=161453 RepID=UPI00240545B2|nr:zinc finger protein 771-like isoform X1 [Dunckerocampus dactyliophorus]